MANYMFVLRPIKKSYKTICSTCYERGEVLDSCFDCHGAGIIKKNTQQYFVQEKPIEIIQVDRDPKTGVLRYWENASEFYYETVYPELHRYTPKVPHGIHLCHDTKESAQIECERINKFLKGTEPEMDKPLDLTELALDTNTLEEIKKILLRLREVDFGHNLL